MTNPKEDIQRKLNTAKIKLAELAKAEENLEIIIHPLIDQLSTTQKELDYYRGRVEKLEKMLVDM